MGAYVFDAMATPFSAICREYATIETDILRPESVPAGSVVLKKKGMKVEKVLPPSKVDNERVAHLRSRGGMKSRLSPRVILEGGGRAPTARRCTATSRRTPVGA